jgi:release factor glutamine methyltransferase
MKTIIINPMKNKIRIIYSLIYFNLIHKRKLNRTVTEKINEFTFTVYPSVFNPKDYYSSVIIAEFISRLININNKLLLDMGCGSGIISIFAASSGALCTAVDKNPESVKCAKHNAVQNKLANKIVTVESDLFENLKYDNVYDIITFNPPYYKGEPANNFEMAFKGGENLEIIQRFFENGGKYLSDNGVIYLITSSDSNLSLTEEIKKTNNFKYEVVLKEKRFFESFYIYRISDIK